MTQPIPLEFDRYYHIYNRGNNRENLFRKPDNYHYFLQLYTKHIHPITDTFAYCLLPNHFHLLVRIKAVAEICQDQVNRFSDCHLEYSNFWVITGKIALLFLMRVDKMIRRQEKGLDVPHGGNPQHPEGHQGEEDQLGGAQGKEKVQGEQEAQSHKGHHSKID